MAIMAQKAERLALWVALGLPMVLLLGAYFFQYIVGLPPCEMCWWQRYPLFVAVALAIVSLTRPQGRTLIWLAAVAIAISGFIGAYHAGVEYGWWEGVTTCTVLSSGGSGDPMDAIMNAPLVRCDTAPWSLFNVSLAGWNFLFSIAGVLTIALLLSRREKGLLR